MSIKFIQMSLQLIKAARANLVYFMNSEHRDIALDKEPWKAGGKKKFKRKTQ